MKIKYLKQIKRNIKYIIPIMIVILVLVYMYCMKYQENFDIDPSSFQKDIQSGKKLVLFYADWCGYCKKLKPQWDAAAKQVNEKDNIKMIKINVGDANDANQQQISNAYKIQGYPTILILDSGKEIGKYKDELDTNSLVSYCNTF